MFAFFSPHLSWLLKLSRQLSTLKTVKRSHEWGKMPNGHIYLVLDNRKKEGFPRLPKLNFQGGASLHGLETACWDRRWCRLLCSQEKETSEESGVLEEAAELEERRIPERVSCQGGLARPPPGCLTLIGLPLLHTGRGRLAQTQAASSPACCGHCAQQASGSQTWAGLSLGLPSSRISVFTIT